MWGFLIGVVALTVLPFLQQLALRAPEPLAPLGVWSLPGPRGQHVDSLSLQGKVWLGALVPSDCDARCTEGLVAFGGMLRHLEDLGDQIVLVTFVLPPVETSGSEPAPSPPLWESRASPRWRFALVPPGEPRPAVIQTLERFLPPSTPDAPTASTARFFLVDQTGALRGLWTTDELGRGNLINAARLLARRGPTP